ncbi:MAG: hypothetical protein IIA55_16740, partial [Gemmatimonadetes bacterium]|nr:hypothetical protein [Gemmatimonadota bacterium]
ALLQAIWKTGDAPAPSVAAITTRSLPAPRAFLDGEAAITRGALGRYRGCVLMSTPSPERALLNARTDAQYAALFQWLP